MKLVVVESPWRALTLRRRLRNEWYARSAVWDCIKRGEVPFAGHLLYTQVLDDGLSSERETGIKLHAAWIQKADLVAVYLDLGLSTGMKEGVKAAERLGVLIEERRLYAPESFPEYLEDRQARTYLG